jgi:hypothetical protein
MSRVVSVGDSEEVAVDYTVTEGCFSTREEALAEIAARGWHAVEYSVPAEETELPGTTTTRWSLYSTASLARCSRTAG